MESSRTSLRGWSSARKKLDTRFAVTQTPRGTKFSGCEVLQELFALEHGGTPHDEVAEKNVRTGFVANEKRTKIRKPALKQT